MRSSSTYLVLGSNCMRGSLTNSVVCNSLLGDSFYRVFHLWKFFKDLVILFHRISTAPWGHVASIIKRATTGDSPSFCSTPPLLATGPFVAALDGKRIWYLLPARTQERRTHVLS